MTMNTIAYNDAHASAQALVYYTPLKDTMRQCLLMRLDGTQFRASALPAADCAAATMNVKHAWPMQSYSDILALLGESMPSRK